MLPLHAVPLFFVFGSKWWHQLSWTAKIFSRKASSSWYQNICWSICLIRCFFCGSMNFFETYCAHIFSSINLRCAIVYTVLMPTHTITANIRIVTCRVFFSPGRSPSRWVRPWLPSLPGVESIIIKKLSVLIKPGTPLSHSLVDTLLPMHSATIRRWISVSLTSSEVRNVIIPRCTSIVRFCYVNIMMFSHALQRQLDETHNCLLFSCAMCSHPFSHRDNPAEHYIYVRRLLSTLFQSRIFKFQQLWLLLRFVPFHLNMSRKLLH